MSRHVRKDVRRERKRGLSLLEMLVVISLGTVLVLANLRVLSAARRIENRDRTMTRLSLAANTKIARLRVEPWDRLAEGEKSFSLGELRELGLDADGKTRGGVRVSRENGMELKEIRVWLERSTPMGPAGLELSTWRGRTSR